MVICEELKGNGVERKVYTEGQAPRWRRRQMYFESLQRTRTVLRGEMRDQLCFATME